MSWSLSHFVRSTSIVAALIVQLHSQMALAADNSNQNWGAPAQNAAPQQNSNPAWYNRAMGFFANENEKPAAAPANPASGFWQPGDAPQMISRDKIRASGASDNWFQNSNAAPMPQNAPMTIEPLRAPTPPASAPLAEYPNLASVPLQPPSQTPPAAWADQQKQLESDRDAARNTMQQDWLQTLPVTPTAPVADYTPPPAPVGDSMPNVQSYEPLVAPKSNAVAEDTWKTPIIIQNQSSKDLPITANDSFSRNARGRSGTSSVVRVQSDNVADTPNLPWGQEFNNGWNAPAPKPAAKDDMPWLNAAPSAGGLNVQQPMPYLQSPNYPPIGPDLSITMPPANASGNLPALVPPTSSPVPMMPPVVPMAMPSPYNAVPPLVPPSDLAVWNKWSGNTIQPPMAVAPTPPMIAPFVAPTAKMGTVMPYDPIAGSMLNYQQRMQQSAPYTSGVPYAPYGKDMGWWYNNPNWATYNQNRNTPLTSPLSNDRFDKPPVSLTKPVATIYFKDDSTALDAGDTKVLKQLADWFENRGGGLRVVGHSSSRTKDMDAAKQKMQNYKLSLDRAEAVGKKLQSMGVSKNKLNVTARGDSEKQFAESMPSGDAWNRRVEIYWDMF